MAQLALGAVGAVVGGLIGGPVGASIGWGLGTALGASFTSLPDVQGPRLSDLNAPASQYGTAIPWVKGTAIVTGFITHARDIVEVSQTEDVGGKGGPSQEVTTYSYFGNWGVHLCRGPIDAVRRVWLNDTLVYDARDTNTGPSRSSHITGFSEMRIYRGTEDQLQDEREVAIFGANRTPAYRGIARLVFYSVPLRDFGNTMPRVTAEVVAGGAIESVVDTFEHDSGRDGDVSRNVYPGVLYDPQTGYVIVAAYNYDDEPHYIDLTAFDADGNEVWVCRTHKDSASDVYMAMGEGGRLWYADGTTQVQFLNTATGFDDNPANGAYSCTGLAYCPDSDEVWYANSSGTDGIRRYSPDGSYIGFINTGGRVYNGMVWVPSTERMWACRSDMVRIYSSTGTLTDTIGVAFGTGIKTAIYDEETDCVFISDGATTWKINASTYATSSLSTPGARSVALDAENGRALYVNTSQDLIEIDIATMTQSTLEADVVDSGSGQWHAFNPAAQQLWFTQGSDSFDAGEVSRMLIGRVGAAGVTLQELVELIAEGVGIEPPTIDASALTDEVRGWVLARRMPARAALDPLRAAYAFDLPEVDGELVAVKRGGASVRTITFDELAAHEPGTTIPHPFGSAREQETALPANVELAYLDVSADYELSVQRAKRLATTSVESLQVELPVILDASEALERAAVVQSMLWIGRNSHRLTLTRRHLDLCPSAVIEVENEAGEARRMLVLRADYGRPGLTILETVDDDASIYDQDMPGVTWEHDGSSITVVGPALLFLMDTVLLRDSDNGGGTDAGFYAAVNALTANYPGAAIYKSYDNANWSGVSNAAPAVTGRATTALADGDCTTWDDVNTLTVRLDAPDDTLSSSTDLAVLNGANSAVLASSAGWEVIQFVNVVDNEDGTWTLSRLLRGRRGSDFASAGHAINDQFVLLSQSTTRRVSLELGDVNLSRWYQAVSFGLQLAATGTEFACAATGLKPLSVKHVEGERDESDNLTINWVRRSRIGGGWTDGGDVPLGEETEAYEVDIMDGDTVVRTLEVTDETATYSAADQTTDFGSAQAEVDVIIYQMSATVGRGFPTSATV